MPHREQSCISEDGHDIKAIRDFWDDGNGGTLENQGSTIFPIRLLIIFLPIQRSFSFLLDPSHGFQKLYEIDERSRWRYRLLRIPYLRSYWTRVIVDLCSTSNEIRAFIRFDYRNDLFRIDPWPWNSWTNFNLWWRFVEAGFARWKLEKLSLEKLN